MRKNNSVYDFENYMVDSIMTEKAKSKTMYDVRRMSEYIKEVGRPLTSTEAEQFVVY